MKRNLLIALVIILSGLVSTAQNIVFNENFDPPSGADSVTAYALVTPNWAVNTTLYKSGTQSFHKALGISDSATVVTSTFSTIGFSNVMLSFSHICKLHYLDKGEIYVSNNNGVNWIKLSGAQYLGTGGFATYNNIFCAVSYPDWLPGTDIAVPTNAWWKDEMFDISAFASNSNQVKVMFLMQDAGGQGANGNYGWLLDDIKVVCAVSELNPPTITMIPPIHADTVTTTGPFDVFATITDASGVAVAKLVYDLNGGTKDTLDMVVTTGSIYTASIPSFTYLNTVNYYIFAIDSTVSANYAQTQTYSFYIKKVLGSGQNLALSATAAHSGGGATTYGATNYNDGIYNAYGVLPWGWVSSNGWIEYTWANPVTFNKIVFLKDNRPMTACQIQIWDGTTYNTIQSYNNTAVEDCVIFVNPHTTTKLRFNAVTGSNPNHREIQVFAPMSSVPLTQDAGVTHFLEPASVIYTTSAVPVKVRIKNFAIDTLHKVTIGWSLNNVVQTPFVWTGILLEDQVSPILTIANHAFPVGSHQIKVWTTMPNDSIDQRNTNDTIFKTILVCAGMLSGTYTVGPAGDYSSPQSALNALNLCGLNGPVVFNIASGTYNGPMHIMSIPGMSAVNTVTFQSANGDSMSVIITHNASPDNWTLRLNGAKHFKFKKLTLESTGTSAGRVVEFLGGAEYNEISNCVIRTVQSTSSAYAGIYSTSTHADNYNVIKNNYIQNGYYGMYLYGTSALRKFGWVIEGNVIENYYYYGLYLYYHDSVTVKNNSILSLAAPTTSYGLYGYYMNNYCKFLDNTIKINSGTTAAYGMYMVSSLNNLEISNNDIEIYGTSTVYGIYCSNVDIGFKVTKNRIITSTVSTCYPLYLTGCDGTTADSVLVSNNMVSHIGGTSNTVYALYLSTNTMINIYNNSVGLWGGSATAGRALFQTGGSGQNYVNNIFANFSGGFASYFSTPTGVGTMNNNNYYSNGSVLGYWNANVANLSAWKSSTGKDANSLSVDPGFFAQTDLHINTPDLNAAATPLAAVPDDIDGDARHATTPDIGADEFILIANDAGVLALIEPVTVCPGTPSNVVVAVKNYGTDTLKTFSVNWTVNGLAQTPVNISDTILFNQTKNVSLGGFTFTQGVAYQLKFWTSNPNGLVDGKASNDTLLISSFQTAIPGGTYTIGGTGANYPDFTSAIAHLNTGGICGPVVFNVANGTYNEQISIGAIAGTSAINTITFQSTSGDSSAVILTANAASGNYVVRLTGAQHITFRKMSIVATNAASGYAVVLNAGASYNEFANCHIQSPANTSSSCVPVYSTSGATMEQYNAFRNNRILNGYYAFYLYGSSTTALERGNVIEGNIIEGYYYYGIYSYYSDSLQIRNNTMINSATSGINYGMYFYYNDYAVVDANTLAVRGTSTNYGIYTSYGDYAKYTRNKIHLTGASTSYGIYNYYSNSSSIGANVTWVTNNFISKTGANSGTIYGIYSGYSNYVNYYHNSINITQQATATSGYSFYQIGGAQVNVVNNIFSNPGGGYAYYVSTTTAISVSNHNNIYSTGANLGYWGSNITSLAAWKTTTGRDANSVSVDPKFISATNLHIKNNIDINDKGTPLASVTIDIDGEPRSATTPDIGADEFTPPANEVEVIAMYTYGKLSRQVSLPHQVLAIVENSGLNNQINYNVSLNISGANTYNTFVNFDTLKSGQRYEVLFPAITGALNTGIQTVKVSLPVDEDTTNNVAVYRQQVTDTTIAYADTSAMLTNIGYGTNAGLLLARYPVNNLKSISAVRAYIAGATTVGKTVYGVVVSKSGTVMATSPQKVLVAGDINTWVNFPITNISSATISNDTVFVGIAQVANAAAWHPLGVQKEAPGRAGAYYGSGINGGAFTENSQFGRLMIEFDITEPPTKDIAVVEFVSPSTACALGNEPVVLKIKNMGSDTILAGSNTLTVGYKLDSTTTQVIENVNVTILPGAEYSHTFASTLNMTAAVTDLQFYFRGFASLTGDPYQQNDTILHHVTSKYTPPQPTVVSPVSIAYGAQATLTASSPDSMQWFETNTSVAQIGGGASFTTPHLYNSRNYYVSAGNITGTSGIYTIGTGTLINTTTTYPAPYGNWYWGARHQFLILASELQALNVAPGNIEALAFNVQQIQGVALQGFSIKMAPTTLTAMPTTFVTSGFTNVYSTTSYTETVGWNTHQFQTPFVWDGTSNVIIETCFNNSNYTYNAIVYQTATPFASTLYYNSDASTVCTSASGSVASQRPNIRLTANSVTIGCSSLRVPVQVNVAPPPPIDAGVLDIVNPGATAPSGTPTPIQVRVKNYGATNLTSVQLNYSVNGVAKTPFTLTGINLAKDSVTAPVTIATESFTGGLVNLKAWTFLPNNVADSVNSNDTAYHSFTACLNGTYTLGKPSSDFPSFTSAITTLNSAGICGHVVFLVDSGTYNTQLLLEAIPGMGPNATVTFRGATGDSTHVVIEYAATATTNNYVVRFDNAQYYRIEKMTLRSTASATFGRVVEMLNNSQYNIVSNCRVTTPINTSTTSNAVYIYTSAQYNEIINCNLQGGYYCLYVYGLSTNRSKANKLIGNIVSNFYIYGVYAYYQDSMIIHRNMVSNLAYTYSYNMYLYYLDRSEVTANDVRIVNPNYGYGIFAGYFNGSAGKSSLIANNFVSGSAGGSSASYGIYLSTCTDIRVVYNSVNLTDPNAASRSLYQTGGSGQRFLNNIFVNTGGGYATYVATPTGIDTTDYNNLFATGTNLAYWGANITSLAALKTASGKETNSMSLNPNFPNVYDLYTTETALNGAAKPLGYLLTDKDGKLRHATIPDIGAIEFDPPLNDAGVTAITAPNSPVTSGSAAVVVSIKNGGLNNLTGCLINWRVNNIIQPPYNWTGNLTTNAIATNISLGTFLFTSGSYDIKVWTSQPNGQSDGYALNDTLVKNVIACVNPLAGVYTIGGIGADYSTFTAAVNAIKFCGVSDSVLFLINNGVYNEQLEITQINGANSNKQITFRSQSGDSSAVVLQFAATANNYVVYLNGGKYINFERITLRSTGAGMGRTVVLQNGANFNRFEGCVIETGMSTSTNFAGVYTASTSADQHNVFRGNRVVGGYYGFYVYGTTANRKKGFVIENNHISGYYYYGIQGYYTDSLHIGGNTMTNGSNSAICYHLQSYYNQGYGKITANKIHATNTSTVYGISVGYGTLQPFEISNNFVMQTVGTSTVYGIYLLGSAQEAYVYHNSVNVTSTSTAARPLFLSSGMGNRVVNNSFANVGGGGHASYISLLSYVVECNRNNYYTTGANFVYLGSAHASLASLVASTMMDSNSVSADPMYYNLTNLHSLSPVLYAGGKPLPAVPVDIDGQFRSTVAPCIGADEFSILNTDVAPFMILQPSTSYSNVGATLNVQVRLRNMGSDTITSIPVSYRYAGQTPVNATWTGTLTSGQTVDYTFSTPISAISGQQPIVVYTSLPGDLVQTNDTLVKHFTGIPVMSLAYSDNFEGPQNIWASEGSSSGWQRGVPAGTIINSAFSAPNAWVTNLTGQYGASVNEYLYTPYFDFSGITGATMKFRQWRAFADNNDGGQVQVSTDGGTTWGSIGYMNDPAGTNWYNHNASGLHYFTGTTTGWIQSTYDLSNYDNAANPVMFRFRFFSNAAGSSDGWAIDNFEITVPQIATDGGVIRIVSPADSTIIQTQQQVEVRIQNFGSQALTSIPVKYRVNNQPVVTGLFTGTLNPGDSVAYTFATGFTAPSANYVLKAWTDISGDLYPSNDTTFVSIKAISAPVDAGVYRKVSPSDTTFVNYNPHEASFMVRNYGTNALTAMQMELKVGLNVVATENWTGNLAAGDSMLYTFSYRYNSPMGFYTLCAKTIAAGDGDATNDSYCKQLLGTVGMDDLAGNPVQLLQNRPNPATNSTTVEFSVPRPGKVVFEMHNLLGQPVYREERVVTTGRNLIELSIEGIPAGVYTYGINYEDYRATKQMIVVK